MPERAFPRFVVRLICLGVVSSLALAGCTQVVLVALAVPYRLSANALC